MLQDRRPWESLPPREVEEGKLPGGGDREWDLKGQVKVLQAGTLRERVEKELVLEARLGRGE